MSAQWADGGKESCSRRIGSGMTLACTQAYKIAESEAHTVLSRRKRGSKLDSIRSCISDGLQFDAGEFNVQLGQGQIAPHDEIGPCI